MRMLTVVLTVVLLSMPGAATGQSTSVDLSGTVFDVTRGVVPGAELTLVNESTGIARTTHSDSVGHYAFTQLAPGPYRLTASLAGFETTVLSGLVLRVGQIAALDISLKVGDLSTSVVVDAQTAAVETRTSALSSVMDNGPSVSCR